MSVASLQAQNQTHVLKARGQRAVTDLSTFKEMVFALDHYPAKILTHFAMKFLILTALTTPQLKALSWKDVEGQFLRIKACDKKGEREHLIVLSHQAHQTLRAVKPFTHNASYIFPSNCSKYKKMSDVVLSNLIKDAGYRGMQTPNGFRISFASLMKDRHPQMCDVIDLMVGEKTSFDIGTCFYRDSYFQKSAQLSQEWADLIYAESC